MTTNIFLLGMPSSGKSTLGRQLAKQLNYEFVDLDARIEIAEGKKVSEIFSLYGEEHFRKAESQQLKKLVKDTRAIVATGGGTPCFFDNMAYIKENGISVFLDVSPQKIMERMLMSKKNDRPLVDLNQADVLEKIQNLYNSRLEIYRKADIIIEGDTDCDTIMWILDAHFAK